MRLTWVQEVLMLLALLGLLGLQRRIWPQLAPAWLTHRWAAEDARWRLTHGVRRHRVSRREAWRLFG